MLTALLCTSVVLATGIVLLIPEYPGGIDIEHKMVVSLSITLRTDGDDLLVTLFVHAQ